MTSKQQTSFLWQFILLRNILSWIIILSCWLHCPRNDQQRNLLARFLLLPFVRKHTTNERRQQANTIMLDVTYLMVCGRLKWTSGSATSWDFEASMWRRQFIATFSRESPFASQKSSDFLHLIAERNLVEFVRSSRTLFAFVALTMTGTLFENQIFVRRCCMPEIPQHNAPSEDEWN